MNKGNLTQFTVPSTGIEISLIPVSISLETMQEKRQNPPPSAPVVRVNIAGIETTERNSADPNYLQAYKNWESLLEINVMERVLNKIAIAQSLTDDQKKQINERRQELDGIETLPKNDKLAWLFNVAIMSDHDVQSIMKRVRELAEPSEGGIQQAAATF